MYCIISEEKVKTLPLIVENMLRTVFAVFLKMISNACSQVTFEMPKQFTYPNINIFFYRVKHYKYSEGEISKLEIVVWF